MKSKKVIDGIAGVLHNGGLDAHRNYGFMGKSIGIWNDFRRGFAREIYNNRKEIGLFTLDDIEIDLADVKEVIWRTYINMSPFNHINWDKFAEAIVNKNPIKIKGEK